ncbi:cupin domain-containing protein [Amaricoccus sp. B4]|uniref:cupin domain-containing protein n=1 Tax=Amaricoccus sp. B4 TaxID=3368557 RepID=UPI003711BAE9
MMTPFDTNTIPALDSWGTVADLGSEILEGECAALGKMVFGAPADPVSCAYFGATRGVFRMTYPFNEHAVVVEGEVTLKNEATGESRTYGPGEGWFVEKGTPVLWTVKTDRFVKNYLAVA